jgi:hypothetical protein
MTSFKIHQPTYVFDRYTKTTDTIQIGENWKISVGTDDSLIATHTSDTLTTVKILADTNSAFTPPLGVPLGGG